MQKLCQSLTFGTLLAPLKIFTTFFLALLPAGLEKKFVKTLGDAAALRCKEGGQDEEGGWKNMSVANRNEWYLRFGASATLIAHLKTCRQDSHPQAQEPAGHSGLRKAATGKKAFLQKRVLAFGRFAASVRYLADELSCRSAFMSSRNAEQMQPLMRMQSHATASATHRLKYVSRPRDQGKATVGGSRTSVQNQQFCLGGL